MDKNEMERLRRHYPGEEAQTFFDAFVALQEENESLKGEVESWRNTHVEQCKVVSRVTVESNELTEENRLLRRVANEADLYWRDECEAGSDLGKALKEAGYDVD